MTKAELAPMCEHEDDEIKFVCPGCGEPATSCVCGGEAGWRDLWVYWTALGACIGLWTGIVAVVTAQGLQ